jgi:hypothetical protein
MTNFKNDNFYQIINEKQSIPISSTIAGTIKTVGTAVVGIGTAFISKDTLRRGFWIVDLTNNEVRKIDTVLSDTVAYLEESFTSNFAPGTTAQVIPKKSLNIKKISIGINPIYANGAVDGTPFISGDTVVFGKDGNSRRGVVDFIDPIIADATGTTMDVTKLL